MDSLPHILLLAPAVLLPILMLVGFAGCDRVFGLSPVPIFPPVIDKAQAKSATAITLTWHADSAAQGFQFERTDSNGGILSFDVALGASPYDDIGLLPETNYEYKLRAISADGEPGEWSVRVTCSTLAFASTFAKVLSNNSHGWEGYTLVQRIEAGQLGPTGTLVRISLQAASDLPASVDRAYISQADSGGKPYDSAADLTALYDLSENQQQPLVVPAGTVRFLPVAPYAVNTFQALIIAVDFSPTPGSSVASVGAVLTSEVATYFQLLPAGEAAKRVRSSNYQLQDGGSPGTSTVTFITRIEVG